MRLKHDVIVTDQVLGVLVTGDLADKLPVQLGSPHVEYGSRPEKRHHELGKQAEEWAEYEKQIVNLTV